MTAVTMMSARVMPWPPGWMGTGAAAHTVTDCQQIQLTGMNPGSSARDGVAQMCGRAVAVRTASDKAGTSATESMPPIREQDL